MTVWVSDDANHIPVRVESPISVGSVKVDMMDFQEQPHAHEFADQSPLAFKSGRP